MIKEKSERNKTIDFNEKDLETYSNKLNKITSNEPVENVLNKIFNNDLFEALDYFPDNFVDLLILDPPYNLSKNFGEINFKKTTNDKYLEYLDSWFSKIIRLLKPTATIYLCGDWKCSVQQYTVLEKYAIIRNRIVWQREKGRGASKNWKNSSEDILFATMTDEYYFDVDSIKTKKKVIAPYKQDGVAKDWVEDGSGKFRMTFPSNFLDDITVPYWSMPENTIHPTQKPEKLIAKLILASCPENGVVFDVFMGSGTTAVVSKKLGRNFSGIEIDEKYCVISEKRLEKVEENKNIQGYVNGVFLERNQKS